MKITNYDIANMIDTLVPFLSRNDLIGYCSARNTRRLKDAYIEYEKLKDDAIRKYGEQEFNDIGEPTGRYMVKPGTAEFIKCTKELATYSAIEHDVVIMKIPYSEVIGKLTGSEILEIDWMLEDSDSPMDE